MALVFCFSGHLTGQEVVNSHPEFDRLLEATTGKNEQTGVQQKLKFADSLLHEAGEDSLLLAIAHCEKGSIHAHVGDVGSAWPHLLAAFGYFQRNGPADYKARCYGELAKVKYLRGEFHDALQYYQKAHQEYLALEDTNMVYRILGNMGIMHIQLQEIDSASAAFEKVHTLASQRNDTAALVPYYLNMGQLMISGGKLDYAQKLLETGWKLSQRFGDEMVRSNALTNLSYLYFMRGDFQLSMEADRRAIELIQSVDAGNKLLNPYNRSAMSAAGLGDYQQAHHFLQQYIAVKDSSRTAEREGLIASMESRLKLLEKEHEIELLTATNQSASRQKWLYVALFALSLSVLFAFFVRRRKERQLNRAENELIAQKLEVEQLQKTKIQNELNLATDTLTRDALQMIRKNEQLAQLRSGLEKLGKQLPEGARQTYSELRTTLHLAKSEDKDWNEFARLFEQVHPSFWQHINQLANPLTEKEKRLCALIKVNMQNREIAAVLGISPESVKTARYRLRKKLEIESEQDLNHFIQQIG